MKKPFLSFMILLAVTVLAKAQTPTLFVKSGDKQLYLEHKVAAKENFFAIGRTYNVHPRFIAAFNKIDMTRGLIIGQLLRIPLTDTNFSQKVNSGTPVYYKLGENEGLMKVSALHHDVSLANLRTWNGLADNSSKPASKLIVGFLVSAQLPSTTIAPPKEIKKEVEKVESQPVVQDAEIKANEAIKEAVVKETVANEKPAWDPPVLQTKTSENIGEGYFKNSFYQQVITKRITKAETVTSGIFKTTSGWQDEKYYLLIDAVQPGMIVKIINPVNNKAVYAKVLGEMSGIRQNEGLTIRISNAAASALEVAEQDKFVVKVSY